jgi:hypothetical protein
MVAKILCGQFNDFERAELVQDELRLLGLPREAMGQFALNAPGQHDRFPLGGDEDADRGARRGDHGALTGAALGAVAGGALGVAAIPVAGPLAAAAVMAVGAYSGSLAGALREMGNKDGQPRGQVIARPAGVRVAAVVPSPDDSPRILDVFTRNHVISVEESDGTWRDGSWVDFDPTSAPHWIKAPAK